MLYKWSCHFIAFCCIESHYWIKVFTINSTSMSFFTIVSTELWLFTLKLYLYLYCITNISILAQFLIAWYYNSFITRCFYIILSYFHSSDITIPRFWQKGNLISNFCIDLEVGIKMQRQKWEITICPNQAFMERCKCSASSFSLCPPLQPTFL